MRRGPLYRVLVYSRNWSYRLVKWDVTFTEYTHLVCHYPPPVTFPAPPFRSLFRSFLSYLFRFSVTEVSKWTRSGRDRIRSPSSTNRKSRRSSAVLRCGVNPVPWCHVSNTRVHLDPSLDAGSGPSDSGYPALSSRPRHRGRLEGWDAVNSGV